MKKQILFALPLMAAMLLSCKSNKSKGNPTSADLPDPSAPGVTVVEQELALGKLSSAVGKVVAADALGLKAGVSVSADAEINLPGLEENTWDKSTAHGAATVELEANVKGLRQTGIQNYKADASLNFAEDVSVDLADSFVSKVSIVAGLDPETIAFLSDLDLATSGELGAYFDGARAYLDISEDFVDAVQQIAGLNGVTVDENNIQAGKFKSPEIPLTDALRNFNFAAAIQQYAGDALANIDTLVAGYVEQFQEYFDTFTALKYSDTRYALYAEADLLPIILAQLPEQYATLVPMLLNDDDTVTGTVGVIYDVEKGIESIGVVAEAHVTVTAKELGMDSDVNVLDADVAVSASVELKTGADVAVSASVELKTGADVTVVELTDAQKAEYQDMPTGGAVHSGEAVPEDDGETGPLLA